MKILISLLLIVSCSYASAQSVSTSVKFREIDKPALMLYLPHDEKVTEETILAKLKEIGYEPHTRGTLFWRQSKVDGYYVYRKVLLKGEKNELVDLYFKVDRRGSKKDDQSVIYMMTSKGVENFISDASEPQIYAQAQNFLNGFVTNTAEYNHTLNIKTQEETVNKAEKKLKDLMGDENDITNKITKLQEELKKNREMQINQQALIESEKRKLADMKLVKQ